MPDLFLRSFLYYLCRGSFVGRCFVWVGWRSWHRGQVTSTSVLVLCSCFFIMLSSSVCAADLINFPYSLPCREDCARWPSSCPRQSAISGSSFSLLFGSCLLGLLRPSRSGLCADPRLFCSESVFRCSQIIFRC